jgi:hypothetical protein
VCGEELILDLAIHNYYQDEHADLIATWYSHTLLIDDSM